MTIVFDPGHGGDRTVGGSTPFGVRGRLVCEKEIALALATQIHERSPQLIRLTRNDDRNLALADRIATARELHASTFVSLHAGGSETGVETWIHPCASPASRLLAQRVAGVLGGPILEGRLAVLDPDHHGPGCGACLVELGRLGAANEPQLVDAGHRSRLADALVRAAVDEYFDIWHEVPLVQQLTGMSCWAAAAAMIVGWRDCIDIEAADVAQGARNMAAYRDGLEPRDVEGFARAWGLEIAYLRELSVPSLRRLLEAYGPLWVGEASPGLHVIVVAGMYGNGTVDGSFVRIADPWPVGRGERYTITFREFCENLVTAASLAGGHPQVLHARRGARKRS
jgi:hypothetical protein